MREFTHVLAWIFWMVVGATAILLLSGCEEPPRPYKGTAHLYEFGDDWDRARAYETSPETQEYLREVERIAREDHLRRLRERTGVR